jgi:NAD(P)-dependent dehydrogenase (short-subunit alcohol dehydrogenase family)
MTTDQRRVAIVTGAGTGIGQAIAHAFNEVGIRCLAVGRRQEPLDDTRARAHAPDDISTLAGDVTDAADRARIVAAARDRYGRIDILVNNAGVSGRGHLLEYPESEWRRVMATNVDAVFFLTQAVLPAMRDGGYGRIVIVASMYGSLTLNPDQYDSFPHDDERGPVRQPAYHTSKSALLNLTRELAGAVAPWNVTVNSVSPGYVLTDQSRDLMPDEIKRRLTSATPLKRFGEPWEIASAVRYLASEEAGFITGTDLLVDGGWSIW